MDRRMLDYYERELGHLRTVAEEFAREHPRLASRLALDDFPCPDPYVERLLEGFAYLAARVQLKIDAEFPRFTQSLLETIAPHYLAPTPAMGIVQFHPDPADPVGSPAKDGLEGGFPVPAGTVLRSMPAKEGATVCQFRTAHDVTLHPVTIESASYVTREVGALRLGESWDTGLNERERAEFEARFGGARAALRIRLGATGGLNFNAVSMDRLNLHLNGGPTANRLFEQLIGRAMGVIVRPVSEVMERGEWQTTLGPQAIRRTGLSAKESLLPFDARSFQGYRLLQEYFAFPRRFLFVEVSGLRAALARCRGPAVDIIIPFSREDERLDGRVTRDNILTHCAPAINLFPKRLDRVFVTERSSEFQVIADKTRPLDYEIYRVLSVVGYGARAEDEREFRPFYTATDLDGTEADARGRRAYFTTHRVPRALSEREQKESTRTSYTGSEVMLSIVDAHAAPYSPKLTQLGITALCTNRDLPMMMRRGVGKTDFSVDIGGPVQSVRMIGEPTRPTDSRAMGDASWRLIQHLSLNYMSLDDGAGAESGRGVDSGEEHPGAKGLRRVLELYSDAGDAGTRKQISGVRAIRTAPIVRRVPLAGGPAFARGLEIRLTLEESMYEGGGAFVFSSVLEQFLARYVSTNSFTELVVETTERGEVMRWTAKPGQRPIF